MQCGARQGVTSWPNHTSPSSYMKMGCLISQELEPILFKLCFAFVSENYVAFNSASFVVLPFSHVPVNVVNHSKRLTWKAVQLLYGAGAPGAFGATVGKQSRLLQFWELLWWTKTQEQRSAEFWRGIWNSWIKEHMIMWTIQVPFILGGQNVKKCLGRKCQPKQNLACSLSRISFCDKHTFFSHEKNIA